MFPRAEEYKSDMQGGVGQRRGGAHRNDCKQNLERLAALKHATHGSRTMLHWVINYLHFSPKAVHQAGGLD